MSVKNDYAWLHGPSNPDGIIEVTWDAISRWAKADSNFALMDFARLDEAWAGRLDVLLVSHEELHRAMGGYEMFKTYTEFPQTYGTDLRRSLARLAPHVGERVTLTVLDVEPTTAADQVTAERSRTY